MNRGREVNGPHQTPERDIASAIFGERSHDRGVWRLVLVALTLTLVLESARVLFPILFDFAEEGGRFILGGAVTVVVFAAPLLAPVLLRAFGIRVSLMVSIGVLVGLRILLQVVHPVPFRLAAAATVAGLLALAIEVVALRSMGPEGNRDLVLGVLASLPLDVALRGAFLGWDHAWQEGLVPLLVTAALAGAAVASAGAVLPTVVVPREGTMRHAIPVGALGPFLLLQVLLLGNLGFVASSTGLSLPGAIATVLVGDALALLVASWLLATGSAPLVGGLAAGLGLAVVAYAVPEATGTAAALLVLLGHALGAALLIMAFCRPVPFNHRSSWRTSVAFALGSLAFALLLVAYQIHYVVPLPFSNRIVLGFAALLLALTALDGGGRLALPPARLNVRLAALPLALLIVPALVSVTEPAARVTEGRPSFRLVDFNARLAVNVEGQVDPEGTALAIEGQGPDVVLLQEVGRGWPINGTLDLAEWLSRRLAMPYVFAPAADGQFGNTVLSKLPILSTESDFLPLGAGPQRRSYLLAELDVGEGPPVTVVSVHLQDAEGTDTRSDQIRALLSAVGGRPRTIIAGDMNMQPDEPDVGLFEEAGFVSVQDEAGLGEVSTASQPKVFPVDRVNWMVATTDLAFTDFEVVPSSASDHLPLAATVTVGE